MADKFSRQKRSQIMSRIKGTDTKPEKRVRSCLHRMGYRFRLHAGNLPGKPDIVLPRHKKVIFVHGCFWHGHKECKRSALPKINHDFWQQKIDGNILRDQRVIAELKSLGWCVLIVWECQAKNPDNLKTILHDFMEA